ncbi:hypothetical protein SZ00_02017 [Rhodococcus sp. AD45]|nr:hypothetical protein SZ00_02017 [Rhodococcus sp. AD45]
MRATECFAKPSAASERCSTWSIVDQISGVQSVTYGSMKIPRGMRDSSGVKDAPRFGTGRGASPYRADSRTTYSVPHRRTIGVDEPTTQHASNAIDCIQSTNRPICNVTLGIIWQVLHGIVWHGVLGYTGSAGDVTDRLTGRLRVAEVFHGPAPRGPTRYSHTAPNASDLYSGKAFRS